jgi:hypothetical protein
MMGSLLYMGLVEAQDGSARHVEYRQRQAEMPFRLTQLPCNPDPDSTCIM